MVETALVVVNTVLGVEVQTRAALGRAATGARPRHLLQHARPERADFEHALGLLKESFGAQVVAVQLPSARSTIRRRRRPAHHEGDTYKDGQATVGDVPADLTDAAAAAREKLIDAVASTNDDLAEKYLMEEESRRTS